ncbi:MAG: hypothetical protein ACRD3C_02570 [Vicinamibacterales bacterium]
MSQVRALLIVTAIALALPGASAQVAVRTFDEDPIGSPPPGLTFSIARQQIAGRWLVRAEGPNHYLTHLADPAASGGFSLAVLDTPHPAQMRASVRLKLLEGERVGGLVWRYQDAENFYLAALDLRLQELALYRVVRGNRIRLDDEDELELDESAWHSVRVVQDDDDIRVSLGGIGVIRARDRTIADEGRAGVWSGGGATAWFDDLRVEPDENRGRGR